MATKVIDNNESRVPFFGDKISFIVGLDPLGLQNPSSQAYSHLLPGLNNVTSRIRNYSFYCWLLNEYAKTIESSNPQEQKKFIRRAEYIIALLSVRAGIPGISGSNYVDARFRENLTEFNLQTGTYNADGSTAGTYWQYGLGVFGQYYLGSMRQIGLIDEPVDSNGDFIGIYRRTSKKENLKVSGEDLMEAFEANITQKNKTTFFRCIRDGKINFQEMDELAVDFNLIDIKIASKENELLLELLLDVDEPGLVSKEPTSMRKETLIHILRFIRQSNDTFEQRLFTMYAYDLKGMYNNNTDNCLTGWYYYQFNEYYQLASTAVFNGCLDYLQELAGPQWMLLQDLIEKCKDQIIEFLVSEKMIASESMQTDSFCESISISEKSIYEKIMKSKKVKRMAYGYLLICKLFKENKSNLFPLKAYTNTRDIGDNDDVLNFYQIFDKYLNKSIGHFIEDFLVNRVIAHHQYVAYRKMGNGTQSTQKFIIEDNNIRQIGNFDPGYTSPRINSLISFIVDLKLLDNSLKITSFGDKVLKQHG
jgi:hypothetical protein